MQFAILDRHVKSHLLAIPAEARIQDPLKILDPGLRRGVDKKTGVT
jgi:hypothetical protein